MEAFVKNLGKTTLLALVAMMAACGDNTVAPKSQADEIANVSGGGATGALTQTDTTRFSMTINPWSSTTVWLGAGNSITFPAHAVCDPTKSSYGMGEWDKPCTTLNAPITVAVKAWLNAAGHASVDFTPVDFTPNIRFVPSVLPSGWVVLSFADYAASLDPMFNILYCTNMAQTNCINEATTDPTVATVRNAVTGQVTRRVKHFSGYMVGAGDDCPDCRSGESSVNPTHAPSATTAQSQKYKVVTVHGGKPQMTASADIGSEGGTFNLPSSGLTVVVPPGAVATRTHFSVTSQPGNLLGYSFEPHGTTFAVPLRVTQSLRSLNAPANQAVPLGVAYFASESHVDALAGTVLSSELLDIDVNYPAQAVSFNIWHFSGYMFVSGRS
jgi:hypothetical protein